MKTAKNKGKSPTEPSTAPTAAAAATAAVDSADEARLREQPQWRLLFPADKQLFSFLLLVAAVVFSNGIRGDLTFDDHLAIERNDDAWADKTSLSSIFFNDFWGKRLDRIESNGSYRPITVLTFRVQQMLMGYRHSPMFLHCFNYSLAFVNVCLVFYLARLYVYVVVPAQYALIEKACVPSFAAVFTSPLHAVPFMAALLYLVHPVHVDSVTSIVGRCELLYCFFGLLGFFSVHRYLNQVDEATTHKGTAANGKPAAGAAAKNIAEERRRATKGSSHGFPARYVVLSAYALILSILCKDSAITFTAIYGVHACVMYACRRCSSRRCVFVVVMAVVELVSYLAFRRNFIGNVDLVKSPLLRRTENPQYHVPKGLFHWLGIRWVIQVKNMELLFFPTSLCCEYSFNCIPHLDSLRDPRVPMFVAVTSAVVAAVALFLYGTFVKHARLAMVGLLGFLWIAIPYAPVSHLFIAVGTFIAERCLYVPSIGAVLLITYAVAAPGLRHGVVAHYFYALLLLCLGWGIFSHRRNEDWISDETLFRSATKTCPNSGKAHSQLASVVIRREQRLTPEILELAQKSIDNDPELSDGYYYLGVHEVNDNHNLREGYRLLRLCLSSPFALSSCRETFSQVRNMLYRNMTEVERLVDDADLASLDSQKAMIFRQASIFALQKEHRPCLAEALLRSALDLWNASQLYWLSDPVHRDSGEATYCNAMYWYGQSELLCDHSDKEKKKHDDEERKSHVDNYKSLLKRVRFPETPTPTEAARRANDLADRLRMCNTDWHAVTKLPRYYIDSYPARMTQFLTVSDNTAHVMERYLNLTSGDLVARNEVLLDILEVTVRQYCHIAVLLNDVEVRRHVSDAFPEHQRALEQGYPSFRQERLPVLRGVRRELKTSSVLTPAQQQRMQELFALGACSDDLTFLAA